MVTAPAVFFAHGSPMSALGGDQHALALRDFGDAHRPDAIVIVSAHWQKPMPVAITSWETAPLIHLVRKVLIRTSSYFDYIIIKHHISLH